VRGNLEAIRVLKEIEDENREATPAEKAILVKYTGWGAHAQEMFAERRPEWANERTALRAALSDAEYEAERAFHIARGGARHVGGARPSGDASTVFKWLGVDKAADIKARHHEKFARGFETYIMEGRAPSHALASVFEKFKAWLVRIYQTVARLGSPINDDIRAVFDRFLTTEPPRVVEAPDRQPPAGIADIHEADVASATPETAHNLAVRRHAISNTAPPSPRWSESARRMSWRA
jgi:hypothetical protein